MGAETNRDIYDRASQLTRRRTFTFPTTLPTNQPLTDDNVDRVEKQIPQGQDNIHPTLMFTHKSGILVAFQKLVVTSTNILLQWGR